MEGGLLLPGAAGGPRQVPVRGAESRTFLVLCFGAGQMLGKSSAGRAPPTHPRTPFPALDCWHHSSSRRGHASYGHFHCWDCHGTTETPPLHHAGMCGGLWEWQKQAAATPSPKQHRELKLAASHTCKDQRSELSTCGVRAAPQVCPTAAACDPDLASRWRLCDASPCRGAK